MRFPVVFSQIYFKESLGGTWLNDIIKMTSEKGICEFRENIITEGYKSWGWDLMTHFNCCYQSAYLSMWDQVKHLLTTTNLLKKTFLFPSYIDYVKANHKCVFQWRLLPTYLLCTFTRTRLFYWHFILPSVG